MYINSVLDPFCLRRSSSQRPLHFLRSKTWHCPVEQVSSYWKGGSKCWKEPEALAPSVSAPKTWVGIAALSK